MEKRKKEKKRKKSNGVKKIKEMMKKGAINQGQKMPIQAKKKKQDEKGKIPGKCRLKNPSQ